MPAIKLMPAIYLAPIRWPALARYLAPANSLSPTLPILLQHYENHVFNTHKVFRVVPKELFRVNNGRIVKLREWSQPGQRPYDILTESGTAKAKALNPATYTSM